MAAVLLRLAMLAAGMGIVEIEIGDALIGGSPVAWLVLLAIGLPLVAAGSAGFMVPLLGARGRVHSDA